MYLETMIFHSNMEKGYKLGRTYCVLKCLTAASKHDSDITMIQTI